MADALKAPDAVRNAVAQLALRLISLKGSSWSLHRFVGNPGQQGIKARSTCIIPFSLV